MRGVDYIKTLVMVKRNMLSDLIDKAKEIGVELKEIKARMEGRLLERLRRRLPRLAYETSRQRSFSGHYHMDLYPVCRMDCGRWIFKPQENSQKTRCHVSGMSRING